VKVRSSEITADVRAFFTTYCTAFIRLDAPAIARHFADQVQVVSETGKSVSVQVESGDEWRRTIGHLLEM
jgi:ketosteroid isomerase-like protein